MIYTTKVLLRQPHNALMLQVSLSLCDKIIINSNVYSPKAFETLIHENATHIVFFIVCEIYFLLVLSKSSIRSKTMCQNVQGLRHL